MSQHTFRRRLGDGRAGQGRRARWRAGRAVLPELAACTALLLTVSGACAQVALPGERAKGRPDAPVTLFEMSDFQCPYCREFALETMPVLERQYVATGKVRFVFINFPLVRTHAHAFVAAEVAMCAAAQDRFWQMHDLLFERQPVWAAQSDPVPYLTALADSAGVVPADFARCMADKAVDPIIQADAAAAARTGAHSTPTFYIEGGLLEGAAPLSVFRMVIDSVYRTKTAGH